MLELIVLVEEIIVSVKKLTISKYLRCGKDLNRSSLKIFRKQVMSEILELRCPHCKQRYMCPGWIRLGSTCSFVVSLLYLVEQAPKNSGLIFIASCFLFYLITPFMPVRKVKWE